MFETLCVVMNLIPGIIQDVVEEALQQTVMAKNL